LYYQQVKPKTLPFLPSGNRGGSPVAKAPTVTVSGLSWTVWVSFFTLATADLLPWISGWNAAFQNTEGGRENRVEPFAGRVR